MQCAATFPSVSGWVGRERHRANGDWRPGRTKLPNARRVFARGDSLPEYLSQKTVFAMVLQQVRSAQEQWHRLNWLYRLAQAIERVQFRIGIQEVRRAPCELRDQRLGIAPPLAVAATGSMLGLNGRSNANSDRHNRGYPCTDQRAVNVNRTQPTPCDVGQPFEAGREQGGKF